MFFISIVLFSQFAYSKIIGEFNCSEPQYGYINGILNQDEDGARVSSKNIKDSLNIKKDIKTFYNQSEGFAIDLIRSLFQKIEESNQKGFIQSSINNLIIKYLKEIIWSDFNIEKKSDDEILKIILTDNQKHIDNKILKSYNKNKKLIIFSHSQGNLYANQACENLGLSYFKNIQIATPSSEIKCGDKDHYTSIHSDEMIVLLNKLGKPVGSVLGFEIKSPLKTNVSQMNGKYIEKSIPFFVTPVPLVEVYNIFKFIQSGANFQVHSIDNYLLNPPSLSKIKSHHQEVLGNNYNEEGKKIIQSEDVNISCDNVKDYLNQKIEITRNPATILGKSIKISKNNPEKVYIEQKGDKYIISQFDLDSWFFNKFWYLYILAAPFALILGGSIASSVKKSEEYSNRDQKR